MRGPFTQQSQQILENLAPIPSHDAQDLRQPRAILARAVIIGRDNLLYSFAAPILGVAFVGLPSPDVRMSSSTVTLTPQGENQCY